MFYKEDSMQFDLFQQLSASSKKALEWAFASSNQRSLSAEGLTDLVSSLDLIFGIFMAHPEESEPYMLFKHFQVMPEVFYDALRPLGGFAPSDVPSDKRLSLDHMPPLDSEGEQILDKSFMLMEEHKRKERLVHLRDLFGGILLTPNKAKELLQKVLVGSGVPFEEVVKLYPEFLSYPPREMSFEKFLAEQFPSPQPLRSEEAPASRFAVSGFSADIRTERDLIGIGSEVDAFAYLIAAKALHPPMAVGLFGDWGSGKSFFMEALRKRIHTITADAQQSRQPQREISIYKYVAQIEFNAWHYVEGELWASLVEHIFRNLKTRSGDEPTLLQQRQQLVIKELEIKRRDQQEAQAHKAELESQLFQTQACVARLEKERQDALKKLNDLKAKDILKAIQLSDQEKDEICNKLNDLGIKRTMTNAAELIQGADELHVELKRGNALITPLRERGIKWIVALIFIISIGPIISLALSRIGELPPVTNLLVSISAFLSGLTIMLRQGTIWLSNAQAKVEGVRLKLDSRRSEAEVLYHNKIDEAQLQYNEKATEYDKAKNEEKKKECEIAELEQELQRITPGRLLLDFINERVGSMDYRKHLGIAALIRSDFEQLSQLITERNKDFGEKDDGTIREEDQHLINRIVLYIDDLDRCPQDRVVQVLQAIHLLLAFPLFVVVVAVDARWLSQSLQAHYHDLLTASTQREGLELSKGSGRQASPQDYLEKIFQVPFWVSPLPKKARIRIVEGLVREGPVLSSITTADDDKEKQTIEQTGNTDEDDAGIKVERADMHMEPIERGRLLDLGAMTDLKPEGLDIKTIELQFMDDLCSLLGQTPRSVKRFVNVYRLIKAISLNQNTKFVEDRPNANFKLVLFLLAVLTGLPAISREFFRQLLSERSEIEKTKISSPTVPTGRTVAQVLGALRDVVVGPSQTFLDDSDSAGQDTADRLEVAGNGRVSGRKYKDWNACRELYRLESWLHQYEHGNWLNLDAIALADWAPQVIRFSYRREEF